MNNLYDIVEICLQDVENGLELEKILARYPEQAEELRPILQASINARQMAVPAPSSDVVRRNRAKLLQHAAQMREIQPAATNRWFPSFQRLAVALAAPDDRLGLAPGQHLRPHLRRAVSPRLLRSGRDAGVHARPAPR